MHNRMRVAWLLPVAAALTLSLPSQAPAAPPPYVPVHLERIRLPAGFHAGTPIWTKDGRHLLFSAGGELYRVAESGRGLACLSCGLPNDPQIKPAAQEAFKDIFPDGRRVLWGDFSRAFVLDCHPSLLRCRSRELLPVDADAGPGSTSSLGGGVWHLSPDGRYLGWTVSRPDTRVMLVARLVRQEGRYAVTDARVVNPPGPPSPTSTDPRGWTNGGALYELKGFAHGGRSIIYVAGRYEGNPDIFELNLRTGRSTRLTGNPDWDEGNGMSPDGRLLLLHSDRGMHRVDAAGLVPRRSFIDYPIAASAAIYYVSTPVGYQCDLQPWLLPASGDRAGRLTGQPLDPYTGGRMHAQVNIPGRGDWSPDSTRVALNEMSYRTALGTNRLVVARLGRAPERRQRVVRSRVGRWALTPAAYHGVIDSNRTVTVRGLRAGTATIRYGAGIVSGNYSVTYAHYSDDGRSFVDGTESIDAPLFTVMPSTNHANIRISGEHTGYYRANFIIGQAKGVPKGAGSVDAKLDGYRLRDQIPQLGPCPRVLPRRQPLRVRGDVVRSGPGVVARVQVTANPAPQVHTTDGRPDVRPVERAQVRIAGRMVRTNAGGWVRVSLPAPYLRRRTLHVWARAGDTFRPVSRWIRAAPAGPG